MDQSFIKHLKIRPAMADIISDMQRTDVLYDFCCDHGNLGIACILLQKADRCIFVDKIKTIIEDLKQKIVSYGGEEVYKKCDFIVKSCEQLEVNYTGTVVLIGIGAKLVLKILIKVIEQKSGPLVIYVSPENAKDGFLDQLRQVDPGFVKKKSFYVVKI